MAVHGHQLRDATLFIVSAYHIPVIVSLIVYLKWSIYNVIIMIISRYGEYPGLWCDP